jgi:hypothetical protein
MQRKECMPQSSRTIVPTKALATATIRNDDSIIRTARNQALPSATRSQVLAASANG